MVGETTPQLHGRTSTIACTYRCIARAEIQASLRTEPLGCSSSHANQSNGIRSKRLCSLSGYRLTKSDEGGFGEHMESRPTLGPECDSIL
jgi:hypothetical protein